MKKLVAADIQTDVIRAFAFRRKEDQVADPQLGFADLFAHLKWLTRRMGQLNAKFFKQPFDHARAIHAIFFQVSLPAIRQTNEFYADFYEPVGKRAQLNT